MSFLLSKFKNSDFIQNTLILSLGAFFAQLISVIVSPLLSRLYSPADFGEVGIIIAFTNIFLAISTLKFDMAVVLSSSSNETRFLIKSCHFLVFLTGVIALPFFVLIHDNFNIYIISLIFLIIYLNGNYNLCRF